MAEITYGLDNQYKHPGDLDVVTPEANQLLIDCDSKADELWVDYMMKIADKNDCPIVLEKVTTSKNKRRHYYLRYPDDLDPIKRVALQAIFGSDRHREFLSLLRIERGIADPTVLYETTEAING